MKENKPINNTQLFISDYIPPISDKELEWYKLNQKSKKDLKAKPRIWKQDFSEIERTKKQ